MAKFIKGKDVSMSLLKRVRNPPLTPPRRGIEEGPYREGI